MRLRRALPAVQGDTLHIVGVGDNRIGKEQSAKSRRRYRSKTQPLVLPSEIAFNPCQDNSQTISLR